MKMTNSNQFYEGCGQEGPIRCIFLSEFHDTAGSKITCQVNKMKISLNFTIIIIKVISIFHPKRRYPKDMCPKRCSMP